MARILSAPDRFARKATILAGIMTLPGCASLGSLMSPYSEKFSCKNSDHGQCIHPDKAYEDAVAGKTSRSDPAVTSDGALLKSRADARRPKGKATQSAYPGYRESVYHELKGLIEAPTTPMLRPGRTIRTLILPYADRERPDRLYMPRYVYSILDKPQWVVGDYLIRTDIPAQRAPIAEQSEIRRSPEGDADIPAPAPRETGQ
ncbi:TraV family lipoprotein [Sphingobium naphthae]|nr:TraV family lipoprotein [Sphingobium naphthae]